MENIALVKVVRIGLECRTFFVWTLFVAPFRVSELGILTRSLATS